MGTHEGEIKPSDNITVSTLYTYPCAGTGEHTESIELYDENDTLIANGRWNGHIGDYHNITIHNQTGEAPYVTLLKGHKYWVHYLILTTENSFCRGSVRRQERQYFSRNSKEKTMQKGDIQPCKKRVMHPS